MCAIKEARDGRIIRGHEYITPRGFIMRLRNVTSGPVRSSRGARAHGLFAAGTGAGAAAPSPQAAFKGTIKLDVRDSEEDWTPYTPKKAPEGAPNFLFVLYDDTGLAAWSPYGGRINMPTLDKLAANGLTYTQWHTTALCSPTRSTLLTGRNHHVNGMAAITEAADGFPGASGRLPDQAATIGQLLQDGGWSTYWLGKNHNVAEQDVASGASRKAVAAPEGIRSLLRFPRRRNQPVVSRPRRRQPVRRAAIRAGRGLSLLQGPGRPGHLDHPRSEGHQSVAALVHVVQPGRQSRAASRAEGLHRQVQGQVRRWLRGVSHVGARADDCQGCPAEGHADDAAQPDAEGHGEPGRLRPPVGFAERRTRRSCSRASPKSTRPSRNTRTCRSAASSTTCRRPVSSRTPS